MQAVGGRTTLWGRQPAAGAGPYSVAAAVGPGQLKVSQYLIICTQPGVKNDNFKCTCVHEYAVILVLCDIPDQSNSSLETYIWDTRLYSLGHRTDNSH